MPPRSLGAADWAAALLVVIFTIATTGGILVLIFCFFLFSAGFVSRRLFDVGLFLLVVELFPLGTEQFAYFTEARIGILCLDPLAPVLTEEHVRREGTLGCLGVFLTCTASGRLLCLLGGLACLRRLNISEESPNGRGAYMREGRGHAAHFGLGRFFRHLGHGG